MLSQDEVNQLIANHMNIVNNSTQLTDIEKNTLIEIVNASFESSIHVLQNWTDKKISITKSVVELTNYEDLIVKFPIPYVVADITYKGELSGKNLLLFKSDDIKTLDAIFSGEEVKDKDKELDQLQLSNITGVLDKMSNTAASSVSKLIHTDLGVDNLVINIINFKEEEVKVFSTLKDDSLVCINFQLNVEEFPALGLTLLMDLNYSKSIVSGFFNEQTAKEHKTQQRGNTSGEISDDDMYALNNNEGFQSSGRNVVRPVHLESFDEPNTSYKGDNMDILMDIPLQVAVELGRTKKSLKEILGLNVGSIVTLDKLVGEPVDIVINSKAIAKGEVVVCDDNFGVRIMDILNTNAK